jgi:hypothetical protein
MNFLSFLHTDVNKFEEKAKRGQAKTEEEEVDGGEEATTIDKEEEELLIDEN